MITTIYEPDIELVLVINNAEVQRMESHRTDRQRARLEALQARAVSRQA